MKKSAKAAGTTGIQASRKASTSKRSARNATGAKSVKEAKTVLNQASSRSDASGSKTGSANSAIEQETAHAARWTFLTNHSHVLIVLSKNPSMVLREVALKVGITERAVQRIIADLEEADVIERHKVGRNNQYRILDQQKLRHPVESHCTIADLLRLIDKR